jgi:PAS domain S-box-containing protein
LGATAPFASFNQAAATLFSLTPADVGRALCEIRVLKNVPRIEALCEDAIARGASCQGEVRDATGSWFVLRIAPYKGSDQQIAGAVLTLTNVTGFRASLEQAVYEREYTKAIINTVTDPLVVLDEDLQIQTANQAFYTMFQVSRDQTQGVRLYDLGNGDWTAHLRTLVKDSRSANGQFEAIEVEHEFATIGRRTVLLNARRLARQGNLGRLTLLAIQDITERKQAEEALRESEERYRNLFNLGPVAIYSIDTSGVIQEFNRQAAELWGREPALGDTDERFCGSFKLYRPDGTFMPHEQCPMAEVVNGKISEARDAEVLIERPNGSRVTVVVNIRPLKSERGEIIGAINCFYDITERKQAEAALREAQTLLANRALQLEKIVQERTTELQKTIGELEHFSYTITHDMRAPLRAMQGFGSLLLNEAGDRLTPEKGADYLKRIIEGARRMDALIRDALQYTKIVRDQAPLVPIEPAPLLRGIIESYPALQAPQVKVCIVAPVPAVLANEGCLAQCFSNLLINAVKFVQPGIVPQVRAWAETRDDNVRFWFEDNGIGIPQHYHERIFDMFQQLDKSYEGTGIGLALVRKAAERMGGKVGVESEPGKGSRFWLELKRA